MWWWGIQTCQIQKCCYPKFKADLTAFVNPVSVFTTDSSLWCLNFKWWNFFNFVWICDLSPPHLFYFWIKMCTVFSVLLLLDVSNFFLANFIFPGLKFCRIVFKKERILLLCEQFCLVFVATYHCYQLFRSPKIQLFYEVSARIRGVICWVFGHQDTDERSTNITTNYLKHFS